MGKGQTLTHSSQTKLSQRSPLLMNCQVLVSGDHDQTIMNPNETEMVMEMMSSSSERETQTGYSVCPTQGSHF